MLRRLQLQCWRGILKRSASNTGDLPEPQFSDSLNNATAGSILFSAVPVDIITEAESAAALIVEAKSMSPLAIKGVTQFR